MTRKYKVPTRNLTKGELHKKEQDKKRPFYTFAPIRQDLKDYKLKFEETIPKKLKKIFKIQKTK